MSAWMITACGAKVSSLPVTRSSKRVPSAISRSAFCSAVTADDRAVHAGHAEVLGVAVRERAARHQRGDHRDAGELGQLAQLRGGARLEHAAADVEHRAARVGDQPGRLADLLAVRPGDRAVAGQVDAAAASVKSVCSCSTSLGRSTSTGPGRPVEREVERLGDGLRDVVGVLHQEVVLGDRQRDAGDVGFLEGVGADDRRGRPGR